MADNNPLDRSDAAARQRLIDANQIPATSPPAPPVDSTPAPPATTVQEAAAPVQKVGNTPMPDFIKPANAASVEPQQVQPKETNNDPNSTWYRKTGEALGGLASAIDYGGQVARGQVASAGEAIKGTVGTVIDPTYQPPEQEKITTTTGAEFIKTGDDSYMQANKGTAIATPPSVAPTTAKTDAAKPEATAIKSTVGTGMPLQSAQGQSETDKFVNRVALDPSAKAIHDDVTTRTKQVGTVSTNQVIGKDGKPIAVSFDNGKGQVQWGDASGYNKFKQETGGTAVASSSGRVNNGSAYVAPQLDSSGRYIAPQPEQAAQAGIPPQPEQTAQVGAMPQQPAYNQPKFKSNVLPDRFANEQMQSNIALANSAVQEGIADPSNAKARNAGKFGERYLKQLQDYDIQGNIAPQLKQQENAQQDLNQRRSGTVDSWKAMLANENANKSLSQRGQEESARLGQQASQFGQTNDLAQKRLAMESQPQQEKYITVDKYDDQGNKIGQDLRGQTTGLSPEDKQAQQNRASQAKKAIDQQIAEARKTGDNQKLIELANKRQALG